ncbi:hypothetical protein G4Z16_19890 [Streptomyces bathyalis]|uniref:Uncharacterized protein n=1 Tax=Streptomyces bathyalis TaxID=2710756 RepID=A0A7T1T8C7_9ACTN|nr:hypothetical protein [Streptomyces bathyalis]QPP08281.1 hypothetical protein G4Z16_19890 [Streptomyces bathyalis]
MQSQIDALGELSETDQKVEGKANLHLEAAREQVEHKGYLNKLLHRHTSTDVIAAMTNIREAEVELTRLLQGEDLRSRVPRILTHAREHLSPDDPQRRLLEKEWGTTEEGRRRLPAGTEGIAAETLHAANKVEERERIRLRSFTHILICSITVMSLIAVGFGIWAVVDPNVANLFCFPDQRRIVPRICPIGRHRAAGSDVFLIEFMGMFAAALAGAASLKTMRGNSSPYHVSILLLLLRLPVGAMTAVLGILLVSGAFFPGLTSLDASAQIIAWAAAFGILQEPVTRAVDRTGRSFLDELTPPEAAKTRPGADQRRHEPEAHGRRKKRIVGRR